MSNNQDNGNSAAMREALEYVKQWREDCISEEGADNVDDMMAVVNAALSAPARNCDLFGTEAEAESAFIAYYNEAYDLKGYDEIDTCDLKHDVAGILHDYIQWLLAPAKPETKGEGK